MNGRKSNINQPPFSVEGKRDRKKAITVICALFGFVVGIVVLSLILLGIFSQDEKNEDIPGNTYLFYEADYEYDIMSDSKYLELDRQIYFNNPETGLMVAISKDDYIDVPNDQKEYVLLLCDFIEYAIAGKTDELNALFSDEYIEADGKTKMDFTMQQLYNIKITYVQTSSEVVDGTTHTSYDYWLEYMIRMNNGTFRNDMESDCVRKEYVRVTQRPEKLGIDVLAPYTTEQINSEVIGTDKIMKISLIAAVAICTVTVIFVLNFKKKSKKKSRAE